MIASSHRRPTGGTSIAWRTTFAGLVLVVVAATATAACGDDAADAADAADAGSPTTSSVPSSADGSSVTVRAADFAYQGLPASIASGTRLRLDNISGTELHELVAIPLAADEARPVAEIVQTGLEALLTSAPPALVVLATPGSDEQIVAVGDGTLTTPGRYALICMIPTGVEPEVYLAAAAASDGGPPQVAGGPPHIAHGMFAEITVTG